MLSGQTKSFLSKREKQTKARKPHTHPRVHAVPLGAQKGLTLAASLLILPFHRIPCTRGAAHEAPLWEGCKMTCWKCKTMHSLHPRSSTSGSVPFKVPGVRGCFVKSWLGRKQHRPAVAGWGPTGRASGTPEQSPPAAEDRRTWSTWHGKRFAQIRHGSKQVMGTFLVVQCLRLHTPNAGALDPTCGNWEFATTKDPVCHNQDLVQPNKN